MKKGKILLSGLLSLTAFSLFTNVNAEEYIADTLPDTFTTRATGRISDALAKDETKDAVMVNRTIITLNGAATGRNIVDYHTTTGLKTFCINRIKDYAGGKEYKKDTEITDDGFEYIISMAPSYYNDTLAAAAVATAHETQDKIRELEMSWMTQAAIWQYQDDAFAATTALDPSIFEEGVQISTSEEYIYSTRAQELWNKAKELSSNAKKSVILKISDKMDFRFDGGYELNKDTKLIKTGLIQAPYTGIMVDLSKAPDGTKVYYENGSVVDTSKALEDSIFYLEFPIENVDNYSFDFDISASYDKALNEKAYKYVVTDGSDYQPLVLLTATTKTVNGAINFKGSHVDDTASVISKSIYFVGFLILIAGVGMIYINVKPKKAQEQI